MLPFQVNESIVLKLIKSQDRDELYALIDENRKYLRTWLLWVDKRQSPKDLDSVIELWTRNYEERNGFDSGICFNGQLVGMLGLHYIDWNNRATSIGYFLAESAQGKGIITKSIERLLKYLFNELKLNRVIIQCAENNLKSRAIPEKIGFSNEGTSREAQWVYDHYENIVTYSLLSSEWRT
ncbi:MULTISPECIES: GNAT family N-acetyltransferase [unclassified Paenibacillus]|uniref:GNAT family N-acetyltransferase n=1 Tax=unclassified Paenibacillus TaxID=185978 RepID=UPI000CFAD26D|nr:MULTISPECIES: GNAT family protein [unclassified Paenibacillus]PRA07998.1 RimJ/RimL family protein N-acetyltransferase [Paenibacillus sp. MYb63]PRA47924.1 RimJ/RimL family protein N-acetyltransferase [Paenibacillus sp. MYb67]QZN74672.1 GNAT family N-acetyltransferase [Paenibacillus sp. DR312]